MLSRARHICFPRQSCTVGSQLHSLHFLTRCCSPATQASAVLSNPTPRHEPHCRASSALEYKYLEVNNSVSQRKPLHYNHATKTVLFLRTCTLFFFFPSIKMPVMLWKHQLLFIYLLLSQIQLLPFKRNSRLK